MKNATGQKATPKNRPTRKYTKLEAKENKKKSEKFPVISDHLTPSDEYVSVRMHGLQIQCVMFSRPAYVS